MSLLKSLSPNDLENAKALFNWLAVGAGLAVWVGVFFEQEKFSKKLQDFGWSLLLIGLAAETALGIGITQVDNEMLRREGATIVALGKVAVAAKGNADAAKATAKAADRKASDATERLRLANAQLDTLSDQERRIRAALTIDEDHARAMDKWGNAVVAALAPRQITKEQLAKFKAAGDGRGQTIFVYEKCDTEAFGFAIELEQALQAAGFNVRTVFAGPPRANGGQPICFRNFDDFNAGISTNGITIVTPRSGEFRPVGEDLIVRLQALGQQPVAWATSSDDPNIQYPALFIGEKSPPFWQFSPIDRPESLEKWMKAHPAPWEPPKPPSPK